MARKQETPAPLVDAKDSAATTETTDDLADGGSMVIPEGALVPPNNDETSGPTVSAPPVGTAQELPAGQAGLTPESGPEAAVLSTGQGAVGTDPGDGESSDHAASVAPETGGDTDGPAAGEEAAVSRNPVNLQIYPVRSYMDEGELRRRGGPAYTVPRRHAEELVRRNLAALEPLKE